MSRVTITDSLLTGIADAIRAKTGGSGQMTPAEMAQEIADMSSGYTAEQIAEGTYTGDIDTGNATTIKAYAFMGGDMDSISGAHVTRIDNNAFHSSDIASASFPLCTTCGDYTFYACRNLASVNLPLLQAVPKYCFWECSSLRSLSLPSATLLWDQCLSTAIEEVDFPNVQQVNGFAFYNMPNIQEIWLPAVTVIQKSAFNTLAGLRTLKLGGTPSSLPTTFCYKCNALTDIYVPWAENQFTGAPWGATNATIHYNCTFDSNGNVISG